MYHVTYDMALAYGGQLHHGILVLEDTGPAIIGGAWLQLLQVILILFGIKIIMNYLCSVDR